LLSLVDSTVGAVVWGNVLHPWRRLVTGFVPAMRNDDAAQWLLLRESGQQAVSKI